MIRTQLQIEKRRGSLEIINKQIEFYSNLDGRLGENDTRKNTDPMSFIAEKFSQAQVKEKYNDLALENTRTNISKFYSGRIMYQKEQTDLLYDLQISVYKDLEKLKKKRQLLLDQ